MGHGELGDDVYEIRMDHPGLNALGHDLMGWLESELAKADGRPVLLSSAGRAFCAGLDLNLVSTLEGQDMKDFLIRLDTLIATLYTYPAPTVALVNGHAIAGGCVLTLCCDYRIAVNSPRTRIGLNEVALGVTFPPRILQVVSQRVPRRYHERVLMGASLFNVESAREVGLIDAIVEADAAEATAKKHLETLGAHPAIAYATTKAAVHGGIGIAADDEDAFYEAAIPVWTSEDVRAKVRAALGR